MGLKAVYTDKDSIPTEMVAYYKEQDGNYLLDVEADNGYSLENVQGLKTALQSERNNAKALSERVNATESKYAELAQNIENSKKTETTDNGRVEQMEAKLAELQGLLGEKDSKLQSMLLDTAINQAVSKVDLVPHGNQLLLPHIRSRVGVIDGQVKVLDDQGQVRISSDSSGTVTDMGLEELLNEMKTLDAYAPVFKGVSASGSGAKTTVGNSGTVKKFADMNLDERSVLYSKDPNLYERLSKES